MDWLHNSQLCYFFRYLSRYTQNYSQVMRGKRLMSVGVGRVARYNRSTLLIIPEIADSLFLPQGWIKLKW